MQETKNSSWYSTVAGALFALGGVMELFQWLSIFRFMSFGGHVQKLLWVASYACGKGRWSRVKILHLFRCKSKITNIFRKFYSFLHGTSRMR